MVISMNHSLEFAQRLSLTYNQICKPLCHELGIPQTAFDILLFLANNPEYQTARDIVDIRKIKANLVSVNVDRLVKEGYLTREAADHDRRKTRLLCTEKAIPVIERGRALQDSFFKSLFDKIPAAQTQLFFQTLEMINANLEAAFEDIGQTASQKKHN